MNGIAVSPPSGPQQSHVSESGVLAALKSTPALARIKRSDRNSPLVAFGILHDDQAAAFEEYKNLPVWVVKYAGFPLARTATGKTKYGFLYCFVEARTGGQLSELEEIPSAS